MTIDLAALVAITGLAAAAPVLADLVPRPKPPLVVVEILLGDHRRSAGARPRPRRRRSPISCRSSGSPSCSSWRGSSSSRSGCAGCRSRLAVTVTWFVSLALAFGIAAGLEQAGVIVNYVFVGCALSTTALGTLTPDPARHRRSGRRVRQGSSWRPERWASWADRPDRAPPDERDEPHRVGVPSDGVRPGGGRGCDRSPARAPAPDRGRDPEDDGGDRPAGRAALRVRPRGPRLPDIPAGPRRRPGRIRGRDARLDRNRLGVAPPAPAEARCGRLRRLRADLLHRDRHALRPRRA